MFELDLRSREPIYEQLIEKIKEHIIKHVLKPDEQLPTVRVLASELTINPNTIQKAYRELENRGYIYSVPGKGNFVRPTIPENNAARIQTLEDQLVGIVSEMLYLGKTPQAVSSLVQTLISKDKGGNANDRT